MKFCSECGAPVSKRIPRDDDRVRFVCDACKTVHYQNPTMVVGAIPEYKGRILLCRRAINPGYGKWTLPAGYLENNVSALLTPSCQAHPTMRYQAGLQVEIYPGTEAAVPYNHPRSWHREDFL